MWSFLKKQFGSRNGILGSIATFVGLAGIPVALAATGVGIPAAILAVATKAVAFGTTAGIVAAKILPGNGSNAPKSAGPGQTADAEDPR